VNYPETFNKYRGDHRIGESLRWLLAADVLAGQSMLPLSTLVGTQSEPAYATIGLGTGTMASYARPMQHVHFYEIDDRIRRLSLPPPGGKVIFSYLDEAIKRGANVQVLMGDARLRMAQPWHPKDPDDPRKDLDLKAFGEKYQGQEYFEKLWALRGGPDSFYHLIVVDAFSSDAIPVHLITKEAIQMYVKKLAPGGVLCVHTSNRHVELVPVVAKVCSDILIPYRGQKNTVTGKYWDEPDPREIEEYDSKLTENWTAAERKAGMKGDQKTWKLEWEEKKRAREAKEGKPQPLVARRGHDNAFGRGGDPNIGLHKRLYIGQYTSEWVICARDKEDLQYLREPEDYTTLREEANALRKKNGYSPMPSEPYWTYPTPRDDLQVWTDDYSNLLAVFRWPWQH
jgi:hypothetical protein